MYVVFVTPCIDRWVSVAHHTSMLGVMSALAAQGIPASHRIFANDPYLSRVRNNLLASALYEHPDMTDLFYIDDDVGDFTYSDVMSLLEHPGEVTAGIYPKKNDNLEFPAEFEVEDGRLIMVGGWIKARKVPTGFLRIKRSLIDELCAMCDANEATYMDDNGSGGTHKVWNIFEMGFNRETRAFWGEDYAFSETLTRMGREMWVNPNIGFSHQGVKLWKGNLWDSVKVYLAEQESKDAIAA